MKKEEMCKEGLSKYKFLVKHDGRRWEIDHVSDCYVFFKTLFSFKDYNGKEQMKINKKGLCKVPISHFIGEIYFDKYYHFE